MSDSAVAIVQPMGHASQIPAEGRHHKLFHHARTAQNAVRNKLCGNNKIEWRNYPQEAHSDIRCRACRAFQKNINKLPARKEIQKHKRNADCKHKPQSGRKSCFNSFRLGGTEVLCSKA